MAGKYARVKNEVSAQDSNQPERKSEWLYQCQAMGCPLKPSSVRGGHQLCTFHNGESEGEGYQFWNAISTSINQNINLIKKTFSLMSKPTEFWAKNEAQLKGWDFCPMGDMEWPSQYTNRLLRTVNKLIIDDAINMQDRAYKAPTKEEKKKKPKGMKSIVELAEQQISDRKDING